MATPQTWPWAAHIESKEKDMLICKKCKKEQTIPIEPGITIPDKKRKPMWLKRIRAIGSFVTKHRYC